MGAIARAGPVWYQEPGIRSRSPSQVIGTRTLKPSSTAFPVTLVGSWSGNRAARIRICTFTACQHCGKQLSILGTLCECWTPCLGARPHFDAQRLLWLYLEPGTWVPFLRLFRSFPQSALEFPGSGPFRCLFQGSTGATIPGLVPLSKTSLPELWCRRHWSLRWPCFLPKLLLRQWILGLSAFGPWPLLPKAKITEFKKSFISHKAQTL